MGESQPGVSGSDPPTADGSIEKTAAANAWTTIDLTGLAGVENVFIITIDFPDNTTLYFNDFQIRL